MEVDGVTTDDTGLTGVSEFNVFESCAGAFGGFTVKHEVSAVFGRNRIFGITLDDDVTSEASDFGSHVKILNY